MLLSATNASHRSNRLLACKGVKTRASVAANSLSIGQSTLATIINKDLPQPKSGPKTVPKKGTKSLKSIVACPLLAANTLALLTGALKATPKTALQATTKGVIGKKALYKAKTTPLKRPTRKINKR